MAEKTKAQIYMGGRTTPIEVDVKEVKCYSKYSIIIESTNGILYETHLNNVLFITKEEDNE